jgi:dTDP-glucose pyrophosphorylase
MAEPAAPLNVVITMAGFGQRFRDAGYREPKYRVAVRGRTLFSWAISSLADFLGPGTRTIFVCRAEDQAQDFIAAEMAAYPGTETHVIALDRPTDGQATSALAAAPVWHAAAPLAIYNIDTHVRPGAMRPDMAAGDGWIPCFRAPGEHWSFVRTDSRGDALEVREKQRISDLATLGLYWFSSAAIFADAYRRHFSSGGLEAGERYIAPIYNTLIADGRRVSVSDVPADAVVALGTPEDVARFADA